MSSKVAPYLPLKILNIWDKIYPPPPYECKSIRQNLDLAKLQNNEPHTFQESYEKYVMPLGTVVYTRTVEYNLMDDDGYFEDVEKLEIISEDEWKLLPVKSDGKVAQFEKILHQKVWESRKNGIIHYHSWHTPYYYLANMMEKIPIPKLQARIPESELK